MCHNIRNVTSPTSCELWLNWAKSMRTCRGAQHTIKTSMMTHTILTTWPSRNLYSIIICSNQNRLNLTIIYSEQHCAYKSSLEVSLLTYKILIFKSLQIDTGKKDIEVLHLSSDFVILDVKGLNQEILSTGN